LYCPSTCQKVFEHILEFRFVNLLLNLYDLEYLEKAMTMIG